MYLLFEFLFYAGLLVLAAGSIWLLSRTARGKWSFGPPVLLMIAGLAAMVTPAVYTRFVLNVDLGPRNALVSGERHITLTGWDQDNYGVLEAFPETVVLQMANPDVTDETLKHLQGMANLRELDLNDTQITDAGLEHLSRLTGLQTLKLRATKITDAGFDQWLTRLPELSRLDLRETIVSLDTVEKWKEASKGRRVFR